MSAKEFLEEIHKNTDKRKSFHTFIRHLRYSIAMEYHYITSAVDYEQIVLDLADLGEIDSKVLFEIDWEDNEEDNQ